MIELKGVFKSYGKTKVLSDINLIAGKERPLVLFGPSGCGKTTLLRLIQGLEIPDAGEVLIDGVTVSRPGWALHPSRRNLAAVFQAPALWPHMTVEKNILFGLHSIDRKSAKEKAARIIEETRLEGLAKRYPHQLSGGQAKRVALARALVTEKKYYLLDEPLSNQDDELKNELIGLILRRTKGARMIFVTHDMDEAGRIFGDLLKIRDGRLER